jgi:methylenetetrahydrofolate reductase (NADPH)
MIWKDEAFAGWKKWASIYEQESESFHLLQNISQQFYLMNIVDNDYISGNLNEVLTQFVVKHNTEIKAIL